MFCPLCKAEYREGFTQCTDCGATLVPALDDESRASDPVEVVLETGDEPQFIQAVEILRGADVPHYALQVGSHSHRLYGLTLQFEFRILVRHSDRERAERLLHEHFGTEEMDREGLAAPANDELAADEDAGAEPRKEIPQNWDPEEASIEIWSGDDEAFVRKLRDCLRENAIPSRSVLNDPGKSHVYVRTDDTNRAREILREITEGTPLT